MMSVIDDAELDLVRASMRHVLDTTTPAALPAALLREGWADLLDVDPASAITTLGEEAGRARSPAPILDLAVLWGAGLAPSATTAVVVDGLALAGAERAEQFVCVEENRLTIVPAAVVVLTGRRGFDPALGVMSAVFADDARVAIGDASVAERAVAAGRRALASQMVGAAAQMLTDTLAYVNERHQYGRAIGSFQTVKHRLAEVMVATTAAAAAVRAAWEVEDSTTAMAAKCLAGRAQQLASTHCFQMHGGIAFTVEHGFQQWVRRGLLLDLLLGPHHQLATALGRRIIERGALPRVPGLATANGK